MSLEHSPDSGNTPQDGSAKPAQTVLDPMLRVPEVLIEMGFNAEDIDRLRQAGAI